MAQHVREFRPTLPSDRVPSEAVRGGYFYVGEAIRILDLDLDYRQARALFILAREQRGARHDDQGAGKWSRFTVEDLASVRALVDLCGGVEALAKRKRLRLAPIRKACLWLHHQGVSNPLLEVTLTVEGDRVFAEFNGATVETGTGQLALDETLNHVVAHLGGTTMVGPELDEAMTSEVASRGRASLPSPVNVRHELGRAEANGRN